MARIAWCAGISWLLIWLSRAAQDDLKGPLDAEQQSQLYATEDREGGTLAIGTDVPALSRTQLSVLSDEEWQKRKPDFIYESWVANAREAIESDERKGKKD
jgi:hypothetical protein